MNGSRAVLAAAALAAFAGCSSYETMDINRVHRAGHFAKAKDQAGLVAAAQAYFDSRLSEMHFWFDLPSEGFLPVVLHFENLSDRAYVLTPAKVSLFLKGGTELKTVPVLEVLDEVRYGFVTPILYFPLLVFVGPAMSMAHRAQLNWELEADYRTKDLYRGRSSVRIPAKGTLEGAVFFRAEGGRSVRLEGATVQLLLTREKGPSEAESAEEKVLVDLE
ncbi:MAG: hypothetical protein MUC63_08385 [Planctomycetes bacterium]|jgi:hypothetical protein|nr:hypothetical protein [Planctomycetota bacterium]